MNNSAKAETEKNEADGKQVLFYIVATPIGNRDDITTRALQILGDVQFIVAEDTRHTGQLLVSYGIKKPLISFRDAPRQIMSRSLKNIGDRVKNGENGAYVTDAGTPGISDPGWRLVAAMLESGATIIPLPGPSAVASIVSLVDFDLDEYRFIGFLPKKKGYQTKIDELVSYLSVKDPRGVVLFESPHRIAKTLTDFRAKNSGLHVLVGRELTKKFETVYRSSLSEEFIKQLPEKGEYVLLIHNVAK